MKIKGWRGGVPEENSRLGQLYNLIKGAQDYAKMHTSLEQHNFYIRPKGQGQLWILVSPAIELRCHCDSITLTVIEQRKPF